MSALLKQVFAPKNPHDYAAKAAYATTMNYIRQPGFYTDYGVPDTFDGRFDLLLLHCFLLQNRMLDEPAQAAAFNQALFDTVFANMDQTLREMGIGDMGVPKHMRRMMKAFNGRMHAYRQGLAAGTMAEALRKNLYGTLEAIPQTMLDKMAGYVDKSAAALQKQEIKTLLSGRVQFEDI